MNAAYLERRAAKHATQRATKKEKQYKIALACAPEAHQEILSRMHHKGYDTAVHEAGHAVACWLQGEPIKYVMFNDRGAHYDANHAHLDAMTASYKTLTEEEIKNQRSALQG